MALTPEERRTRNEEIKAFHQSTLDALGIPNAIVMSKMAYKPTGFSERHIGFFESEISKNEDIYIEFGNIDMIAEKVDDYPLKGLLKYRQNPQYKDEYPTTEPGAKNIRYFVPISELTVVRKPDAKPMLKTTLVAKQAVQTEERESKVSELLCDTYNSDPLVKEMTMRDYAAIHMRKPCSKREWLNDLIIKHN